MKKIITYTEEQIKQIKGLLNGITITGIQNARQIVAIAQVLESGVPAELMEEKGAKEDGTD